MEILLTNMVPIILVIKIFILCAALGILGVSFFHRQETLHMEKRLGIVLPAQVKYFSTMHVVGALFILILFTVITFL